MVKQRAAQKVLHTEGTRGVYYCRAVVCSWLTRSRRLVDTFFNRVPHYCPILPSSLVERLCARSSKTAGFFCPTPADISPLTGSAPWASKAAATSSAGRDGLSWVRLGWVGLGWVGLGWVGLGWVGLGWARLGTVGLGLG